MPTILIIVNAIAGALIRVRIRSLPRALLCALVYAILASFLITILDPGMRRFAPWNDMGAFILAMISNFLVTGGFMLTVDFVRLRREARNNRGVNRDG